MVWPGRHDSVWWSALLAIAAFASAVTTQTTPRVHAVSHRSKCSHGTYNNATKSCQCFEHWHTAGITDTIDWLEGVCEQFRCESHSMCEQKLGFEGPTCPVKGWNCYCGWKWAVKNLGHGYETEVVVGEEGQGGAECMGVMYTFSVWMGKTVLQFMEIIWIPFAIAMVLFLPVGKKRAHCDHHRPSIWNAMQRLCGAQSQCNGQCVANADNYGLDALKDDVAWSFYFFTLMVWIYLFSTVLWCVSMFIWSVVLWSIVALVLIAVAVMGLCAACCEGGGGGGEMSCNCCEGGADAISCESCCPCCIHTPGSAIGGDAFYWGGTYPYDPWFGYSGYGYVDMPRSSSSPDDEGGGNSCWRATCFPIAWMLYVFPAMPENMWGGLLGYYVTGTHMRTPADRLYTGGSGVVEFMRMGWRRSADLHSDLEWRNRVQAFVLGPDIDERARQQARDQATAAAPMGPRFSQHQCDQRRLLAGEFQDYQVMCVGRAHAVVIDRSFHQDDGCFESSYQDYQSGVCWICQGENDEWDLWMSCKHLFCSSCSTQMLQRRMPCPLCRVASSVVLRGHKYDPAADLVGAE